MSLIPGIIGKNPSFDDLRCNNSNLKDSILRGEINSINPNLLNHIIAGCFMIEEKIFNRILK